MKMNEGTLQIYLPKSETSTASQRHLEIPPSTQVNLEDVEDFSNVCRLCATVTELVIPIFNGEGLLNNLAEKICKHLPIQVCEEDVLPLVVCYQCSSTILAWHELVQCSLQADRALRTTLAAHAHAHLHNHKPPPDGPAPDNETNQNTVKSQTTTKEQDKKSETSLVFYQNVKNVLIDYCNTLEIGGDNLDMKFVCLKCAEKPALSSVEQLAAHLSCHSLTSTNTEAIQIFIQEYIICEEILDDENFDRDETLTSEPKEKPETLPTFYCPFCENVFSSTTRLICHLNKHVEVSIDDGVICCDISYNDRKSFVQHLQEQHVNRKADNSTTVCRSCGFVAEDATGLEAHLTETHSPIEEIKEKKEQSLKNQKYIPAVCPECNKTFSNKYNMFVHMKSHSGQLNAYPCDKCNKSYKAQGNLRKHKKLAHEGILRYLCASCGEAFPTRGARDVHARLHSGLKPYSCHRCGNCYRAKNTLDRHLEMHLDIRKHACHICSKTFRKSTHLKYHINTHQRT